ncbi:MAG: hypothetical protein F6J94_23335 [Moorea sp. SIO1F2]|uniref:hypothetical protein n=1 Tax=unclassified Moorena TaxID=2683338 RepID=UPI0013B8993A|nr:MULTISPECIES: hypothetical protein [unclassified Moorena]NEN95221.1 hypothetical protein [Moorena sp. SIO3I7]NEO05885.1 hypothetical protein [Moorena sp. SIO3I8]NEO18438.1 hypothetical protein [Moorena sp. SIO4A5]NEP21865.1 hypothetical protein [Moorena sp. SIO3I6]NEQ58499.1 hypothetical protein [Moorena sp. SIO4A1]
MIIFVPYSLLPTPYSLPYTMNERLEYIEKLEGQINEAQTTLNRLKAEREELIQKLQHEEIERLEEHLENAQVKLKDINAAAEEAWHELKETIEQLLHTISDSLKNLMHK